MSQFAEILSELRKDKGLTQEELSKIINTSKSSISDFENEKRTPNAEVVISLARFFDVTTDYLLGLTQNNLSPTVLAEEIIEGVSNGYVIKSLKVLTPEQRSAVIITIDSMKFHAEITGKAGINGVHK